MAFSITVTGSENRGSGRTVYGTFTSATGDTAHTFNKSVHGLGAVTDYTFTLDSGGHDTPLPKVVQTGSSLVVTWEDTLGYSGKWAVTGKSG